MAELQMFWNGMAVIVGEADALAETGNVELVDEHGGVHLQPVAFGFMGPGAWVSLAMLVFIAILLWKGVHRLIGHGLDARIAAIREQLDDAKALRGEAETLRDEYLAKIANAGKDAEAMLANARREAGAIVERAEESTAAMIRRRERMAEDKIAGAERAAVEELRARAARASAQASGRIIAEKHNAVADKALVDSAIGKI